MMAVLVDYKTKRGLDVQLDISQEATQAWGYIYQDRVLTPKGPATVVGVSSGNLYFHVDGDEGASFWGSCKTASDLEQKGFKLIKDNTASVTVDHTTNDFHTLKRVVIDGVVVIIVMQALNGPCPIIALANALLFRGELKSIAALYNSVDHVVTAEQLREAVLSYLLANERRLDCTEEDPPEKSLNAWIKSIEKLEKQRAELRESGKEMLKRFYNGLCIDPIFDRCDAFAHETDALLFALAAVRLVHGWIMEAPEEESLKALAHSTFDELSALRVTGDDLTQAFATKFLTESSSQLTAKGLERLTTFLQPGEPHVLFHNNHFSTIVRTKDNKILVLVTDVAFSDRPHIVFEALSISGDAEFYSGDFEPISPFVLRMMEAYGERFSPSQIEEACAVLMSSGIESPTTDEIFAVIESSA